MLVITFSSANQTRSKINFDHITSTSLVYANVTIVMEFNFIAAVECEFVGAKKKENVEVGANN